MRMYLHVKCKWNILEYKPGRNFIYNEQITPSSAGSVLSKFRFNPNTLGNTTTQCRSQDLVNVIVLLVGLQSQFKDLHILRFLFR
jgi:hypothetical protein